MIAFENCVVQGGSTLSMCDIQQKAIDKFFLVAQFLLLDIFCILKFAF